MPSPARETALRHQDARDTRLRSEAMAKLPNGERVLIPMEKLTDYCLNPEHARRKDKARVFPSVLGITRDRARKHPHGASPELLRRSKAYAYQPQQSVRRAPLSRKFKTDVRMLPQFGPLEGQAVDTSRGGDETGLSVTLPANMGEGRRSKDRVTRPVRAMHEESRSWYSSWTNTRNR